MHQSDHYWCHTWLWRVTWTLGQNSTVLSTHWSFSGRLSPVPRTGEEWLVPPLGIASFRRFKYTWFLTSERWICMALWRSWLGESGWPRIEINKLQWILSSVGQKPTLERPAKPSGHGPCIFLSSTPLPRGPTAPTDSIVYWGKKTRTVEHQKHQRTLEALQLGQDDDYICHIVRRPRIGWES